MRYRYFLMVVVVLLLFGSLGFSETNDLGKRVVSDVATLRSTLVMELGGNIFRGMEVGSGNHPFFRTNMPRGAGNEHRSFLKLLRNQGVRIYTIANLLDDALQSAREKGVLEDWIKTTFPATADRIIEKIGELNADSILNRNKEHFYLRDKNGGIQPLFPGITSMYWSRDFAISTPKGLIIGHGKYYNRRLENSIARLIFEHSSLSKEIQVVFDAEKEGVILDGGDTIILDESTILLGVGNRSDKKAAALLAQKLEMDVVAVNMPPGDKNSGVRRLLLHLDSIFNLVDHKTILAVPYFLEKKWIEKNPITPFLLGISRQIDLMNKAHEEVKFGDPEALVNTVDHVSDVGWVTHYEAGTGKSSETGEKLVDRFKRLGYRIIYVGGIQPDGDVEEFMEKAAYELRWQGANVVQLGPGKVVAFEHNLLTNQALRDAGIEVLTFPGELLSIRGGGPHCLLMPLERY